MQANTIILLIYSTLIMVGGVMGYLKGGSLISLMAGGGSGLILFILSYFSFKKERKSEYAAIAILFLLDGFFTYRCIKTLHFFPSGAFSIISLLTIILLSINLKQKPISKLNK